MSADQKLSKAQKRAWAMTFALMLFLSFAYGIAFGAPNRFETSCFSFAGSALMMAGMLLDSRPGREESMKGTLWAISLCAVAMLLYMLCTVVPYPSADGETVLREYFDVLSFMNFMAITVLLVPGLRFLTKHWGKCSTC